MKRAEGYLSRREQQIMELVYERGSITTAEAMSLLPGEPANSTVRTLLKILEQKGHLAHAEKDGKYIYKAVRPRQRAARSALEKVISTFYQGSVSGVLVALLSDENVKLSTEEAERLQELIQKAQEEGR